MVARLEFPGLGRPVGGLLVLSLGYLRVILNDGSDPLKPLLHFLEIIHDGAEWDGCSSQASLTVSIWPKVID